LARLEAVYRIEARAASAPTSARVLAAQDAEAGAAMKFTDVFRNLGSYVVYYPSLNSITGSVTATIFLSNLLAWEGSQDDPDGWIYKSQKDIERETGLTRHEQDTARRLLRTRSLIEEDLRGVPATMHYRLNLDAIDDAWEANLIAGKRQTSLPESGKLDRGKAANKRGGKRQTINSENNTGDNTSLQGPQNELTLLKREQEREMWEQLKLLGIPDRPTYLRVVGRAPYDDPAATLELARRRLAEKQRQA
jgi:hypothetical protein